MSSINHPLHIFIFNTVGSKGNDHAFQEENIVRYLKKTYNLRTEQECMVLLNELREKGVKITHVNNVPREAFDSNRVISNYLLPIINEKFPEYHGEREIKSLQIDDFVYGYELVGFYAVF